MKIMNRLLSGLVIGILWIAMSACQATAIQTTAKPTISSIAQTSELSSTQPTTPSASATIPASVSQDIADTPITTPAHDIISTSSPANLATLCSLLLFRSPDGGGIVSVDGTLVRQFEKDFIPLYWSPSGKNLLLASNKGLFIAEADGSDPRLVYENEEVLEWTSTWLTDNIILVSMATVDYAPFNPKLYYLEISTGELQDLNTGKWHVVEAVSPGGQFWIQSSTDGFELVRLSGRRIPILQGFRSQPSEQPLVSPSVAILPSGKGFVFDSCLNPHEEEAPCRVYFVAVSEEEVSTPYPIYVKENRNISYNLRISPNGRYLAFVQTGQLESALHVIDLETQKLVYTWPWKEPYSPPNFVWSPDSTAIAFRSVDATANVFRIVKLNLQTGQTEVIIERDSIPHIRGWQYIEVEE